MENLEDCIGKKVIDAIDEITKNGDMNKPEGEVYTLLIEKHNLSLDCAFAIYDSLRGLYENGK